jgi:hypothetical protein
VLFALAQLGKPYEWAAEGPNRYDCSGLMWAAYRSVGITIPRVAADQYHGLQPVSLANLLPGDLLFFSTDRTNWRAIHHVGMYIGDGKMVHAPTTGDVVRIAPIWYSEYFGAARVVAPRPGPIKKPTPTPTPSRTPSPPTTPAPTTAPPTTAPPTSAPPTSTSPSPTPTTAPPTTAPPTSDPPDTSEPEEETPAPDPTGEEEESPAPATTGASTSAPASAPETQQTLGLGLPASTAAGGAGGVSLVRRARRRLTGGPQTR